MTNIDSFADRLFEEAKRFLEKGKEATDDGQIAYLHAGILLSFSALEAHINAIADEQLLRDGLSLQDRSILMERDIKFKNGQFELGDFKMYRLQDRIEFLCRRFGRTPLNKSDAYWSGFLEATRLRNNLTHPKDDTGINKRAVELAILSVLQLINAVFIVIYGRPHPGFRRGLDSNMNF